MKPCAVRWCAAEATNGDHCPIHAKHPTLHPEYLGPDEEFAPDLEPCEECDGTGECQTCDGDGECDHGHTCYVCGSDGHGHDCGKCDGTGDCKHCAGAGRVCFKKKAGAA